MEVGRLAPGQLDPVHRGHGQTRPVDDAADIAVKAHVRQTMIPGGAFARILWAAVTQFGDFRAAEPGVGVADVGRTD